MPIDDDEFNAVMAADKWIEANIRWREDNDGSPERVFRVDVETNSDEWEMFVQGRYLGIDAPKLSFSIILRGQRIYALDMGREHRPFPDKHKHANGGAYEPEDITAPANNPVQVWRQFCQEARIDHRGEMYRPFQSDNRERLQ